MSAPTTRQYAYFQIVQQGAEERLLVFDTQEISIGRAKEADLRSESAEMSRKHAVLVRSKQGCAVQNYSTSNATLVNGVPVKTHALCDGDVVAIADLQLTFFLRPENPAGLGQKLSYASELKGFAPQVPSGDGEATVLGMLDGGGDSDFVVRPAGEFEPGMRGSEGVSAPRDLDLELEDFGLDDVAFGDDALDLEPVAITASPDEPTRQMPVATPAAPPRAAAPAADELLLEDEAWTLEDEPSPPSPPQTPQARQTAGTVSLHLELDGLSPDLQATVRALVGKVIDLPKLRIRIKDDDLA